jgi:hypothetical protein
MRLGILNPDGLCSIRYQTKMVAPIGYAVVTSESASLIRLLGVDRSVGGHQVAVGWPV